MKELWTDFSVAVGIVCFVLQFLFGAIKEYNTAEYVCAIGVIFCLLPLFWME